MPGHKSVSKDNISFKTVDIKKLLNKTQNQHFLFSLVFSLLNWFSIPCLFPIRENSFPRIPSSSMIIFRPQLWGWWGLRRHHHPAGTRRALSSTGTACPMSAQEWFLLSHVKLQTVALWSLWTNTLLSLLRAPSLCAALRAFLLNIPQPGPGKGREGRGKEKKKWGGGGQNSFYFFFFF